jgi:hypothetical protein
MAAALVMAVAYRFIALPSHHPLPEAQLDRFFFKLLVGYPTAGELAEVLVRSPGNMLGYWNRQPGSQEAFAGEWYRTRDIGRLDDAGYFPGFGYRGIITEPQNNALKNLFAKRDPYCLPGFNTQVGGYGVAEGQALCYRRIDANLGIPHPTLHRGGPSVFW